MPNCSENTTELNACNFLLLPYSNRIRDGCFTFEDSTYQLDNASRHAIHGFLRDQVWAEEELSADRLVATFNNCDEASGTWQGKWPWPLIVRCELSLNGPVLSCLLEVQNKGDTTMPIGGGWHPYFTRNLKTAHPELSIPVTGVYPDTGGDCLPIGGPELIPKQLTFIDKTALSPDQRIDHCFSGLSKPLEIHWPDVGATLSMSGSDNFTHAILFNPDKPYFALEPVTHANDGVNLSNKGIDSGIATLAPGDIWQARLDMELR